MRFMQEGGAVSIGIGMRTTAGTRLPTPGVKTTALHWTWSWHVFFVSFAIAWVRWPLDAAISVPFGRPVFFIAAICGALALAIASRATSGFLDQPAYLVVAAASTLPGTIISCLPLVGVDVAFPGMLGGFSLCGVGGATLFMLWCGHLVRIGTSRATFTLSLNILLCLGVCYFADHLDETASFAAALTCALLSLAGIRRSWEAVRMEYGDNVVPASAPALSGPGGEENVLRVVQGKILVALFVYLLCLVIVRTLAFGAPMTMVSPGGAFAPALVLCCFALKRSFPFDWLYEVAFPLATAGVLLIALPISVYDVVCMAVSDAAFTLLFLIVAAFGIEFMRTAGDQAGLIAAGGCAVEAAALLFGDEVATLVANTFPFGEGFPVITLCAVAIAACTAFCLMGDHRPRFQLGFEADSCALSKKASEPSPEADSGAFSEAKRHEAQALSDDAALGARALAKRYDLRSREREVLELLLEGKSANEIARELFIAQGTVKAHVGRIYKRIGVHSREELFEKGSQFSCER